MAARERWKEEPDEHDYPAAAAYLSLLLPLESAAALADTLRKTPLTHGKAKDLLRASNLAALAPDNVHVAKDLKKVQEGHPLSPVLLARGDARRGVPLVIADGYHRICASYHLDEDADIPCRIADLPE